MSRSAALLLCLLPGLAWATPYDGTYRQAANADCGLVGVDGGAIEISEGIFHGVENQCRMTRPVNVVDMDATLYTMECSGEGTAWTERAMLMHAAPEPGADPEAPRDLIMIWNGFAFKYARCPDPAG